MGVDCMSFGMVCLAFSLSRFFTANRQYFKYKQ